ncbi:MAG: MoaD/ThiS family protein [Pseudomonadota bacterium]
MIRLRYFGKMGDRAGLTEETLDLPRDALTEVGLRAWMERRYGGGDWQDGSVRLAIDGVIGTWPDEPSQMREVCFLPPVSGG